MKKNHILLAVLAMLSMLAAFAYGQIVSISRVGGLDFQGYASTIGNPSSGYGRLFYNSTTSKLVCNNSDGSSCAPTGGSGTVTACGGAANTQIAFFTSATALCGNSNFSFDPSTGTFTVAPAATSGSSGNLEFDQTLSLASDSSSVQLIGNTQVTVSPALTYLGASSGSATIGAATVAGTPNRMNLPITTGSSGQVLSTDGANPQQLSWVTRSSTTGTVTSIATTSPITGGPITATGTIACATCVTSAASLTSNALILGGGGQASATNTAFTTNGTTTLTIGVAAGGNGVLALAGNTSGTATFTAPAVAGTSTNGVTMSNVLLAPLGAVGTPAYSFSAHADAGMYYGANGVYLAHTGVPILRAIQSGNPFFGMSSTGVFYFTSGNIDASGDTAISRVSAGVLAVGNSTQGDASASLIAANLFNKKYTNTLTGQVAAITDTTMVTVGGTSTAYRFTGTINCTATSAAAQASLNLKWTDTGSQAQTLTVTDTCTALGSGSVADMVHAIRAKNATAITFGVTIANTPTYDVDVRLELM